jgi:hypothetical protein
LSALFNRTFTTNYVSGRCGENILRLVTDADRAGINFYNAKIIQLENKGFSVFGMLNVEMARESGRLNPAYPASSTFRNLPGERNWYHHVVLEMDGLIFDYDFGNAPKIIPVADYFEQMFLKEKTKAEGGEFYVGREEKLKTYKINIIDAQATLRAREQRQRSPEGEVMTLGEYLRQ